MEGNTQASSEVQIEAVDNAECDSQFKMERGEQDIITNGELKKEVKGCNEEVEGSLDGEFIKVEKESLDVKDSCHTAKSAAAEGDRTLLKERSAVNTVASRDLLESHEKIKELEFQLEKVVEELKHSESENARLKEEVLLTKEKLEERVMHCRELELNQKRLQEQIIKAEERYYSQISALQDAFQVQEEKHKELINVKEAFDGLTVELEISRKKMQDLEKELHSSAGEVQKFEELSKQSGSHAESETRRALEFERLLEVAKSSAKEMENQMDSLQEELNGLYKKISENQRVEVALRTTAAELSAVQGDLELFKAQFLDFEHRLASKEAIINELNHELDLRKASEEQLKEDIMALENLFSLTKEDLQAKVVELEKIKLKLQDEMQMREGVEVSLRKQEKQISMVQKELAKATGEKDNLEAAVANLNNTVLQLKKLCSDLETNLKVSDENLCTTDSLLSQALASNGDLEQKLKSLEELHQESDTAATTATQKNLELENIVRASNAAAEEAKSQLREIEMQLISSEQKNVELGKQLNLVELKSSNAERELNEFSGKTSQLDAMLRGVEEEKAQLKSQMQEYEGKITQLESALSQSYLRNSELELELKGVVEECADHEGQANTTHHRSLELEDLDQLSPSKAEDTGEKVSELELQLQAANYRIQELEEQISMLEEKGRHSESESMQFSNKVSELAAKLESFQTKASDLEIALQATNEKKSEMIECFSVLTEEKKKFEEELNSSSKKLSEAENQLEVLQNALKSAHKKLESIEQDLKASGIRESEIMEKLKSAEKQLEQQGRVIEQAATRNSELESLHESLDKDSVLKVKEEISKFTNRDAEANSLYEKLKILEDQSNIYEEKSAEAAEKSASLKANLHQNSTKMEALESTTGDLQRKVLEAEDRAAQSFSENKLLSRTNSQLKNKVTELQELLISVCEEKEATAQRLASHMNTISELTDQHSRASEIQSATDSRIREAEIQLQQAIEILTQKDSEAKDLNEKLNVLETKVRDYEAQVHEAFAVAETRKFELEEALLKLKCVEGTFEEMQTRAGQFEKESKGLAEMNMKLTQELAAYESKLNDLQTTLSAVLVEKDETVEQLHCSKKAIEDLTQQLTAESQSLQSKIFSVMEENNLLNETHKGARKELQTVITKLEGQLSEQKARELTLTAELENLKAKLSESTVLQTHVTELEHQLMLDESRLKEEVDSIQAVAAEKEAELVNNLDEHALKLHDRNVLGEKVLQLPRDLHLSYLTIVEQNKAESKKELERESSVKHSHEELEAKSQEVLFKKQVEELEQKLLLAGAESRRKDEEEKKLAVANTELDALKKTSSQTTGSEQKIEDLENKLKLANINSKDQGDLGKPTKLKDGQEVISRDLGPTIPTPSKRKSTKRREAVSPQTSSSSGFPTETTEVSSAMTLKFILGVALVSMIIGVILGKRY